VMMDFQIVAAETERAKGEDINGGAWLLENFRNQVSMQKIKNYYPDQNGYRPVAAHKEDLPF
jgi:hypothetical protein